MVEHKKFLVTRRFEPQFFKPIYMSIQSVGKKIIDIYTLKLSKNLKVHSIFHVLLLKLVNRDASRPNREHNSRPPFDLVDNEPGFKVEATLKLKQLRGWEHKYLIKWKGIATLALGS